MSNQFPPPRNPEYQGAPQYSGPPQYQRPAPQQPQYQQPQYQGQLYQAPQYMQGTGGQQPSPYAPPPAPAKGKPPLWLGIVVTCLAPVLAVVGLILAFVIGQQQLDQEIADADPGITHELRAGTLYTLYTPEDDAVLASGCTVVNPDFDQVTLIPSSATTQTDPDGVVYRETGEFTTDQEGTYRILCDGSFDTVAIAGDGFVTMGLGGVVAVLAALGLGTLGIVLIVANRITAARARRATTPYGPY